METRFWDLIIEGENVGRLALKEIDQPWMRCTFRPAPHFSRYAELFHREAVLLEGGDEDLWIAACDRICDLDIALIDETGSVIKEALLHIDHENEAWFRY